jgi:acetylornithine deacetylase/succinyl-diaminopimelate desuccinylase-like protein
VEQRSAGDHAIAARTKETDLCVAISQTAYVVQVNLKMCFEGMEENGSVNLDKFIESEKDGFFAGADCMCISGEYSFALGM